MESDAFWCDNLYDDGVTQLEEVCAFTFLLGKPQKGFACTIVISPVLSSKPLPMLTASPMGMLSMAGTEYSWSDFWAIVVVADGAGGD